MPAIRISKETYDHLVQAFREQRNVARAARIAGCGEKAAKKAYFFEYDRPEWAHAPIRQLLENEQVAQPSKLAEEQRLAETVTDEHQRSLADRQSRYAEEREDAASQQLDEARAIRAAMVYGQTILGNTVALGQAAVLMVQKAQRLVAEPERKD